MGRYTTSELLFALNFIPTLINISDPGSSVSIVSDYGLVDRVIEVRSPAEAKGFFL
jgi:hypothetical protein